MVIFIKPTNNSFWVTLMVILLSDRKNRCEKEITEILTGVGANYISDKAVFSGTEQITIISSYKKTDLKMKKGIALILDDTKRFSGQTFPQGFIGICEDCNQKALELFSKSRIPVISCGMGAKNTITLSSINSETLLTTLQRTVTDINGNEIEPEEFKIKLKKEYLPFSVMASVAVMLLCGVIPTDI
ncbi:MAG: hypothetical protein IJ432_01750 [Clostridia bacterium]|nr:hypothetical protein [Clostridia bacterium]